VRIIRNRKALLISAALFLFSVSAAAGLFALSRARTYQVFGRLVSRVDTPEKVIALTLDDGPEKNAVEILDLLDRVGARATFYLVGEALERHPELGKAIVERGHDLGNHTYSHRRMVLKSQAQIRDELEKTEALIRQTGYSGLVTFRSPYCKKLFGLPWYLAKTNRIQVTWDIEPESDGTASNDAAAIAADVVNRARPGSIVLLHPWYGGHKAVSEAIASFVPQLKERGYRFVTVSELLALESSAKKS
jgi:peptidoglycan/xylan/chitin deacetylase (PgdA/CDA1 family)